MEVRMYWKLEMAQRVRDFNRAHPPPDPANQALLARFEETLVKAEELAARERQGRNTARAGTRRRLDLRREMHYSVLPQLVRVASLARRERPDVAGHFVLPRSNARNAAYLTAVRSLITAARLHADLLGKHGLAAGLLDDLTAQVSALEATTAALNASHTAHVGARADLDKVLNQLVVLVDTIDGVNRYRFKTEPELLAAWNSARPLRATVRAKPDVPPTEGGAKAS